MSDPTNKPQTALKTKNKVGRPSKEIDYGLVKRLAKIHCTQEEIADFLDLSLRKLQGDAEFMHIYKKNVTDAKMSLRRKQWAAVDKGNITMMIWLGKQYLGQREPVNIELAMPENYLTALKQEALKLMQNQL